MPDREKMHKITIVVWMSQWRNEYLNWLTVIKIWKIHEVLYAICKHTLLQMKQTLGLFLWHVSKSIKYLNLWFERFKLSGLFFFLSFFLFHLWQANANTSLAFPLKMGWLIKEPSPELWSNLPVITGLLVARILSIGQNDSSVGSFMKLLPPLP